MNKLLSIFLALLLLCACAAEPPPVLPEAAKTAEAPVPEPERLESPVPEPSISDPLDEAAAEADWAYAPPDVEPPAVELDWEHLPAVEAPTYIPQSLVDEIQRCILAYEDPVEALLELETGQAVPPERIAQETISVSDDILRRMVIDWDDCLAGQFVAVDFDNDGTEDRFTNYRAGLGIDGRRVYAFAAGQPGGSYSVNYFEESGAGSLWFLAWEGQNYCISTGYDFRVIDEQAFRPLTAIAVTRMEHGLPAEKILFDIYQDPDTYIRTYGADGSVMAVDAPAPADREIDIMVYIRGVNTDFPLPNYR